jgi:hypothetical protein
VEPVSNDVEDKMYPEHSCWAPSPENTGDFRDDEKFVPGVEAEATTFVPCDSHRQFIGFSGKLHA